MLEAADAMEVDYELSEPDAEHDVEMMERAEMETLSTTLGERG